MTPRRGRWDSSAETCVDEIELAGDDLVPSGHPRVKERRADLRFPANDPVQIEILQCDFLNVEGVVVDVSRSGVRVALQTRVGKGAQVKINVRRQIIIFGEVRYCRPVNGYFHAGILIQNVFYASAPSSQYANDDDLSLYILWKGLTTPEIIRLRQHLEACDSCRARLNRTTAILDEIRLHQANA